MEFITFGPAHLNVTDLERSLHFYRDILGMQVRKTGIPAEVGTSERTLVVLHPNAKTPFLRGGYSGLYHVAIHLPSEKELAQLYVRLTKKKWKAGATDHIIAKSIYVNDPDGILFELAFETPQRVVEYRITDKELTAIDDKGQLRKMVEPLDLNELLSQLHDDYSEHPFPDKAIVGHFNLHVGDLQAAYAFYKGIGFTEHFNFPLQGWGDLGAGGITDHRIAVNTWAGVNAPKAPEGTAGLGYAILKYDSKERLSKAVDTISNVEKKNEGYFVEDPAGNKLMLTTENF